MKDVRFNEVKMYSTFKRREKDSGVVTYKKVGILKKSTIYNNEYLMECVVIHCTKKDSFFYEKIGEIVHVSSVIKYGRLGKVTLIN